MVLLDDVDELLLADLTITILIQPSVKREYFKNLFSALNASLSLLYCIVHYRCTGCVLYCPVQMNRTGFLQNSHPTSGTTPQP